MAFKTLRPDNQFTFDCPTLHDVLGPVKMSDCAQTYYHFMRGEKIGELACHALMGAGKCPLMTMVRRIHRDQETHDNCYSPTPKHGELPADILNEVAPVMVLDMHVKMYGVEADMASYLLDPVHVIARSGSSSPAPKKKAPGPTRARATIEKPKPSESEIVTAAASGDLSAVITAAVKKETVKPVPQPPAPAPVVVATSKPKPAPVTPPTSAKKPSLLELARMKRAAS